MRRGMLVMTAAALLAGPPAGLAETEPEKAPAAGPKPAGGKIKHRVAPVPGPRATATAEKGTYTLVAIPAEGEGPTDAEGQWALGLSLLHGLDTDGNRHKDESRPEEAYVWFRKSAEQGYAKGQVNVGMAHVLGRGVERDYDEAVVWFERAADQGHPKAMLELGVLYRDGKGVPLDRVKAVMWMLLAQQQGSLAARFMSGASARGLSPEERQEALRLAREWREAKGYPQSEFRRKEREEQAGQDTAVSGEPEPDEKTDPPS